MASARVYSRETVLSLYHPQRGYPEGFSAWPLVALDEPVAPLALSSAGETDELSAHDLLSTGYRGRGRGRARGIPSGRADLRGEGRGRGKIDLQSAGSGAGRLPEWARDDVPASTAWEWPNKDEDLVAKGRHDLDEELVNHDRDAPDDEVVSWMYIDMQGAVQGPFPASDMHDWYTHDFLPATLKVKRVEDTTYTLLTELDRGSGIDWFAKAKKITPPPRLVSPVIAAPPPQTAPTVTSESFAIRAPQQSQPQPQQQQPPLQQQPQQPPQQQQQQGPLPQFGMFGLMQQPPYSPVMFQQPGSYQQPPANWMEQQKQMQQQQQQMFLAMQQMRMGPSPGAWHGVPQHGIAQQPAQSVQQTVVQPSQPIQQTAQQQPAPVQQTVQPPKPQSQPQQQAVVQQAPPPVQHQPVKQPVAVVQPPRQPPAPQPAVVQPRVEPAEPVQPPPQPQPAQLPAQPKLRPPVIKREPAVSLREIQEQEAREARARQSERDRQASLQSPAVPSQGAWGSGQPQQRQQQQQQQQKPAAKASTTKKTLREIQEEQAREEERNKAELQQQQPQQQLLFSPTNSLAPPSVWTTGRTSQITKTIREIQEEEARRSAPANAATTTAKSFVSVAAAPAAKKPTDDSLFWDADEAPLPAPVRSHAAVAQAAASRPAPTAASTTPKKGRSGGVGPFGGPLPSADMLHWGEKELKALGLSDSTTFVHYLMSVHSSSEDIREAVRQTVGSNLKAEKFAEAFIQRLQFDLS